MRRFPRSCGVLCHVSSLPGLSGIGDLGQCAEDFLDWLAQAGQSLWQVLPLGPPGFGESPYQAYSAFAGNPLLVGLDRLRDRGWLRAAELDSGPRFPETGVDFAEVRKFREAALEAAFHHFEAHGTAADHAEFDAFRDTSRDWLPDYSLFAALKAAHGGSPWNRWEPALVHREPAALQRWARQLAREVERESFVQFQFAEQLRDIQAHAATRGIRLMGDVPIFVAHDSADVWTHQRLFSLDAQGAPTVIAGVPPDYFSATGQRWGNPLYRWDEMRATGYEWWIRRLRHALSQVDLLRLDHFRGFESYWEIPASSPTAAAGRWVPGPGADFFRAVVAQIGDLPIVAEDLGLITPEVEALRDAFQLPGMRILQFAFGEDPKGRDYRPHNYPRNSVVYTGTHDNDTTRGWFYSQAGAGTTRTAAQIAAEQQRVLDYVGTDGTEINWDLIRLAYASVADTAIIPLQDILGLGSAARMNLPGSATGNWNWRFSRRQISPEITRRLAQWSVQYDRAPGSPAGHSPGEAHADRQSPVV